VQRVLAQIQSLDASLSHAIEAYNAATIKLDRINGDLEANAHELAVAQQNLRRSQDALAARLVAIYTSPEETSTLGVLLGATSFDDFLNRLDTVDRVSEQDVRVHTDTVQLRAKVRRTRARLKKARAEQAEVVRERAAHRASIEQQLSERRSLVASIRSEIERMEAAERERQRQAELAARRRLAAARAAPPALTPSVVAAVDSPVAPTPEAPVAAPAARYGGVVGIAMRYLGIPYKWGGASPSTGFDCSGFVMYVYAQVGVSLPHNAAAQYAYGTPVSRSQLQPGDLVFFNGLGHNGIYIGGGSFIHSPHTGDVVKISSLSGWYTSTWVGARRL
jgi:cell wall-associated NlpC family hydrolase